MSVPKDHSIINAEEEKETEKRRLTSGGFSRSGLKSRFSEMCESLPETMDRSDNVLSLKKYIFGTETQGD